MLEDRNFLPATKKEIIKALLEGGESAFIFKQAHALLGHFIRVSAIRKLFRDSQIIFLPHHGTNTQNSQNFLGLFAGLGTPHTFIVSSSPFGKDRLPKASTLEMAPQYPLHPLHYFVYNRDFLKNDWNQAVPTNKPIYMTGAVPSGVLIIMIKPDGAAFLLDLLKPSTIRPDELPFRWIELSNGSEVAKLFSPDGTPLNEEIYYKFSLFQ